MREQPCMQGWGVSACCSAMVLLPLLVFSLLCAHLSLYGQTSNVALAYLVLLCASFTQHCLQSARRSRVQEGTHTAATAKLRSAGCSSTAGSSARCPLQALQYKQHHMHQSMQQQQRWHARYIRLACCCYCCSTVSCNDT
jgi:hypothetical protein